MRYKESIKDGPPDKGELLSVVPSRDGAAKDLVGENEQKIIARVKTPSKGKYFRTLAEQTAYLLKVFCE